MMKKMALLGFAAFALVAFAMAPMVSLHAAETAVAVAPTAAPAAAAPVVVADVSWWQTLWAQVQAPLIALVTAVFSAVGLIITAQINKYLGSRAAQAVGGIYQQMADQAAGWLIAQLHNVLPSTPPTPGSPTTASIPHPNAVKALNAAVDYAKVSYPEIIKKVDANDRDLAKDIVAAAGKMIPGIGAGGGIGGIIGNLATSLNR